MESLWRNIPEFPQFRELALEDKSLFDHLFARHPPSISEFTFTNLFMWRQCYETKVSRLENLICLLAQQGGRPFFFPTIGEGDVIKCYRRMLQYLDEKGYPPKVARVPEQVVTEFDWRQAGIEARFDRDQSDYVYLTKDLITLEGRKYHRKRNHIKQFNERYSYRYITLGPEWISECLRLESEWCDLRRCEAVPGLANESVAIKEALDQYGKLGVAGGAILIDGKVEAFSLAEPLNPETVVIHIEKANPAFEGLYTVINQAFLENHWSGYLYTNREQDLGEEGLKKSKQSYFPHHMVNKYDITLI